MSQHNLRPGAESSAVTEPPLLPRRSAYELDLGSFGVVPVMEGQTLPPAMFTLTHASLNSSSAVSIQLRAVDASAVLHSHLTPPGSGTLLPITVQLAHRGEGWANFTAEVGSMDFEAVTSVLGWTTRRSDSVRLHLQVEALQDAAEVATAPWSVDLQDVDECVLFQRVRAAKFEQQPSFAAFRRPVQDARWVEPCELAVTEGAESQACLAQFFDDDVWDAQPETAPSLLVGANTSMAILNAPPGRSLDPALVNTSTRLVAAFPRAAVYSIRVHDFNFRVVSMLLGQPSGRREVTVQLQVGAADPTRNETQFWLPFTAVLRAGPNTTLERLVTLRPLSYFRARAHCARCSMHDFAASWMVPLRRRARSLTRQERTSLPSSALHSSSSPYVWVGSSSCG